ncbi:Erythroid transcription factor [Allomyces javanicus]|nr:Erythroid transcription factor [Allomyces javanicus]
MLPPESSPSDAGLRRHADLFRRAPPPHPNGSTDAHAPRPLAARQDSGHGGFALPAATATPAPATPFVDLGTRARTASVSALGTAIGLPAAAPLGTPAPHALPETPATVAWTMDDMTGFGASTMPSQVSLPSQVLLPSQAPLPYARSRAPSYYAGPSTGSRSAPRLPPGTAAAAAYAPALSTWTADPSQGAANRRSGAPPLMDAAWLESLLLASPPPPSSTTTATAAAPAWLPPPPLDPAATTADPALAASLPDPTLRPAWTLAVPAEPTDLPDLDTLLAHDRSLSWRSPTLAALNTRAVLSPQLPPGLSQVQGDTLPPALPLEPEVLAPPLPDIVEPASLHLHHHLHHHQPYSYPTHAAVPPPSQQQLGRESLASPTTASTATMLGAVLDWDDSRAAGSPSVSPGDDAVDNPWVNLFRQQSVDLDRASSVAARATLPSLDDMEIDAVDVPRTSAGMWVGAPFSGHTSRRSSSASSEWAESRNDSDDASDLEALGVAGPYAPGGPWCDVPYPGRAVATGGDAVLSSSASNSTSTLSSSASSLSSSPSDSPAATPATHTDAPTIAAAPIWPFAAHTAALDSPGADSVDSFLAHAAAALPPAPGPATTWPAGPRIRLIVRPPPARAAAASVSASPAPPPATPGIPLPSADDLDAFILPDAPTTVPIPTPRSTSGKVRAPSPAESLSTVPTPRSSPALEDDGEYDADGAEDEADDEVSDEEAATARARARQRNRNRNTGGGGGGGGWARKALPAPATNASAAGVVGAKRKTATATTGAKTTTGAKNKSTPRRPPQPPPPAAPPVVANKSRSKKKKKKPRPPTGEGEPAHDDRPKQTSYLLQARDSMGRFGARRAGAHAVEAGPGPEPVENAQRRRHRPVNDGGRAADRNCARERDVRDGRVRVEPRALQPPPAAPAVSDARQRSRTMTVTGTVEPAAAATAAASKRSRTKSSGASARRSRTQSAATTPTAAASRPRTAPATPAAPRASTSTTTTTATDALPPASPKYVLDAGPGSAAQQLWSIFAVRRRQVTADASAAVSLPSAPSEAAAEEAVRVPSPSPPAPPLPPRLVDAQQEAESETQMQAVDLGPPSSDATQQEEGEIVESRPVGRRGRDARRRLSGANGGELADRGASIWHPPTAPWPFASAFSHTVMTPPPPAPSTGAPAPPPKPAFLPYVARRAAASVADRRMQQQLAESRAPWPPRTGAAGSRPASRGTARPSSRVTSRPASRGSVETRRAPALPPTGMAPAPASLVQLPPSAPAPRARSPPSTAWKHARRYERYEPAYATSSTAPHTASREFPATGTASLVQPASRQFTSRSRSRSTSRGRGARWPVSDVENDAPQQQRARTAPRRSGAHAGPIPLPQRPTAPPLAVPPGNGSGLHNAGATVTLSAMRSYRPASAAAPPPTPRSFDPTRSYRPGEGAVDASVSRTNTQRLPSRPKTPVVAPVPSNAAVPHVPPPLAPSPPAPSPPAPSVAASSPVAAPQPPPQSPPRVGPVVEVVPPSRVEVVPVPPSPARPPSPTLPPRVEPVEARGRARPRVPSAFSPPALVAPQPVAPQLDPLLTPPPPAPAHPRPSPLSPLSSVTGEEEAEAEAEAEAEDEAEDDDDGNDGDEDDEDDEDEEEEEGLASSVVASADAGSEYTDDASSCESVMSWAAPAFDEPAASRKARRRPSGTSTSSRSNKRARTGSLSPTAAAATPDAATAAAANGTDPPSSGLPPTKSRGRTKSGKPKLVGIPLATPVGAHAVVDDESASPIPSHPAGDRVCFNCGNTATASWRRSRLHFRGVDDNGMPLAENLCNPCGLYEKLHGCDRPVERLETGEIRVVRGRRTQGVCTNCGATETPAWRRGMNHEPLCNACGLYRRTHNVHRPVLEGGIDEDGTDGGGGGNATETIELPDGGESEPAVVLRAASASPIMRVRRATAAVVLDDRPRKRARFETAPARAVMPWTAVRRPPPLATRRSGESVPGEQRMGAAGR